MAAGDCSVESVCNKVRATAAFAFTRGRSPCRCKDAYMPSAMAFVAPLRALMVVEFPLSIVHCIGRQFAETSKG
jgi:hypothetical protein